MSQGLLESLAVLLGQWLARARGNRLDNLFGLHGIQRSGERNREREEYASLIQALGTEDAWFSYSRKAKALLNSLNS